MNRLAKNLKFLRRKNDITQSQLAAQVKKRDTAISSWEKEGSEPGISEIAILCDFFAISAHDLLFVDLEDVHLSENQKDPKIEDNVHLNVHPSVHLPSSKRGKSYLSEGISGEGHRGGDQALLEAQNTIEILTIAVRGLEAANSVLIKDLETAKAELGKLKRSISKADKDSEDFNKQATA